MNNLQFQFGKSRYVALQAVLLIFAGFCMAQAPEKTPRAATVPSSSGIAAAPATGSLDLESLASDLASTQFENRERATMVLVEAGTGALQVLESLAQSEDAEIRVRARALLTRLHDSIMRQRLDQFLRDADPSKSHGLKSWEAFSAKVGNSRSSKQMLWEIYMAQPQLADLCSEDNDALFAEAQRIGEQIRNRIMNREDLQVGDGLSLVFATMQSSRSMPSSVEQVAITCIQRTPLSAYLQHTSNKARVNQLFGQWLEKLSEASLNYGLTLALSYDAESSVIVARKLLSHPEKNSEAAAYAMVCVARWGTATTDIPLIEPWLSHDEIIFETDRPFKSNPIEVRHFEMRLQDIALASLVKLSDKPMAEFFPEPIVFHAKHVFDFQSLTFPSDKPQLRKSAIERWRTTSK